MGYLNIGSVGGLINRVVPKPLQRFAGSFGLYKASVGLGGLLYGADKVGGLTDRFGITPSRQDIRRMSEGAGKIGKNYTVGGVEYDFRSGRPINPPQSVFIPSRNEPPAQSSGFSRDGLQAGQMTPPAFSPGGTSNGAGVPAQRQDVQNRSLSQEVLNAAQQYSAPAGIPLSSFYEGQQQLGRSMMQKGTLVSELQSLGAGAGMTPENLRTWATQNPDLAYRELLKLRGRQ